MSKAELKLAWCDHKAAKYAVENWHYSATMPAGKLIMFGVWEDAQFIGVVLFGRGANNRLAASVGLKQDQVCELVRVALTDHVNPVSKIVSVCLRLLHRTNPGLQAVVSYADPTRGHCGKIYQAGNWIYIGHSQPQRQCMIDGSIVHKRTVSSKRGSIKGVPKSPIFWKHKYIYPLDKTMRKQIEPLSKPYPKTCASSVKAARSDSI